MTGMPNRRITSVIVAAAAMLNCRKLLLYSRDLYVYVIFHLRSKFRINWPICRRDIAKAISIWLPSAVLTLQNFDFLSKGILIM